MIGDVCGHGPDEAALGVRLRVAWRALVLASRPPDEVLPTLEQVLVHERHRRAIFATVCALTIAPDRRHVPRPPGRPPAAAAGRDTGVRLLSEARSVPPLGVVPRTAWPATDVALPAEWALLLYTDGLIEGRVGRGPERLGGEGLADLVDRLVRRRPGWRTGPDAVVDAIIQEVEALNGGDLVDDVAVLLVGAQPSAGPARA